MCLTLSDRHHRYDTVDTLRMRFFFDWKRALALGVIKLTLKFDDDAEADEDGDGIPDEIEDICVSLSRSPHHPCTHTRSSPPRPRGMGTHGGMGSL